MQTRIETDDTRRIILNAARRLFLAHGYRAVSTRQIAEASGVTQAALYHFFKGKEGLYVAMLRDELGRLHAGLGHIIARAVPTAEKLLAAARFLLVTSDYDFAMMQHDIAAELDGETQAALAGEFVTHLLAPIVTVIAAGQEQGELRGPAASGMRAERAAGIFLSLISHYATGPVPGDPTPRYQFQGGPQAAAREIVELLLYGLATERPRAR